MKTNINITLRRTPDGYFRPNKPEPTSPSEAKNYRKFQAQANVCNDLFEKTEKQMKTLRRLDNTKDDFNSTAGLVVTSEPILNKSKLYSVGSRSHSLEFDPQTRQIASLESKMECRPNPWQSYRQYETTNYSAEPLFLEWTAQSNEKGIVRSKQVKTLRALGDGLYQFTEQRL